MLAMDEAKESVLSSRDEMLKDLNELNREMELESLKQSADLYAEIYEEDPELKELTDAAVTVWPG